MKKTQNTEPFLQDAYLFCRIFALKQKKRAFSHFAERLFSFLNIEAEERNISVLHDIIFSFQTDKPFFFGSRKTAAGH